MTYILCSSTEMNRIEKSINQNPFFFFFTTETKFNEKKHRKIPRVFYQNFKRFSKYKKLYKGSTFFSLEKKISLLMYLLLNTSI